MFRKFIVRSGSAIGLVALSALPAFAASSFENLTLQIYGGSDFLGAFGRIFNFLLLVAGIVAFLFVLWGGFLYLTAGGDAARAENGRKFITNALIGIIIIFLSYSIIAFVRGRTASTREGLKVPEIR